MAKSYIERRRVGRGFKYYFNDQEITDENDLKYFKSLVIPPAWKSVQIAKNKNAQILASGTDKAGRVQYIYHPKFREAQEKSKYDRMVRFAKALPTMRRITEAHLNKTKLDREKVMATIVSLLDQTYLRVGNDQYVKENNSYGITTLRSKHLKVKGDTVTFDFVGKSGKQHLKTIKNRKLSRIIKRLDELPGYEVFKYYDESGVLKDVKSKDVNLYIKEVMGDEFTAKDFRTWGGTLHAAKALTKIACPNAKKERQKIVTQCVKKVAKKLGNTPAVTKSSYIYPGVLDAFLNSHLPQSKTPTTSKYFSSEEKTVLQLLQQDS